MSPGLSGASEPGPPLPCYKTVFTRCGLLLYPCAGHCDSMRNFFAKSTSTPLRLSSQRRSSPQDWELMWYCASSCSATCLHSMFCAPANHSKAARHISGSKHGSIAKHTQHREKTRRTPHNKQRISTQTPQSGEEDNLRKDNLCDIKSTTKGFFPM